MAISRAQLAKELEPGLNALFGLEYDRYENEHAEIFDEETSDRAFEEEVMLGGFGTAPVKLLKTICMIVWPRVTPKLWPVQWLRPSRSKPQQF